MTIDQKPISLPAPAKINLYLHVTGLRQDGYHELDSLVSFAGIHDTLHLVPADNLSLVIEGPFGQDLPSSSNNLVLKAAIKLRKETGVKNGAHMTLEKNLPVASGIGGGSADCAAALKGLAKLWNINANTFDLAQLSLHLGSDVPVCLFGQTSFMGGKGEIINIAPKLPPIWLVLVNPGVSLSTSAVFKARKKVSKNNWSQPKRFSDSPTTASELACLLNNRSNDLTEAAIGLQPVIGDTLKELQHTDGVLLTRMSGSGATCFGLFNNLIDANRAAATISLNHPRWWVCPTPIAEM
jgi:4-diphosphocytidyl-2-C-methyl-D-erythritol kinase